MKCKNCGKEMPDGFQFCSGCGSPLSKKGFPKAAAAIAVSAVAAVLIIGGTVFACLHFMEDSSESGREAEREEREVRIDRQETEQVTEIAAQATEVPVEEEQPQQSAASDSTLSGKIKQLNTNRNSLPSIDIDADNYQAAARDTNAAWDESLFYTLEDIDKEDPQDGLINSFSISKKEFLNADSGNCVEYDIYTNPATQKVNKIVSIEYAGTQLLMTEYYYTDEGKINFIYSYSDVNYFPSFATPDRDGERYYFSGDVLVKLRQVIAGVQTNYVVGAHAAEVGNNVGSVILLQNFTPEQAAGYDAKEQLMIDQAYNTYQMVLNTEGIAAIQGYVFDEQTRPMQQAKATLYKAGSSEELFSTTTDSEGLYTVYVPADQEEYRMEFSKPGCRDVSMYQIEMNDQLVGGYQTGIYLAPEDLECNITLQVYDALNYNTQGSGMMSVGSVEYTIRNGVNCRSGEACAQGTADTEGNIRISLPAGMYTVQVHKDGYEDTFYILSVRADGEVTHFNMSPNLSDGEMRIVLTWSDTPSDLDSHLFTPYCTAEEHIAYYHRDDGKGNSLDVDITTGYGPETVTITNLQRIGLYKYYVADFTNCARGDYASMSMSYSDACVNVYTSDGLVSTFHVPVGRAGVIWEVFEIRNGTLIPSQRYYQAVQDKDWWSTK